MKPLMIGIDGNEANVVNKVGSSEYALRLLQEFERIKTNELQFCVYLKDNPGNNMPAVSTNWRYKVVRPKKLWTQIALPSHLFFARKKPDVFFTPGHYSPRFCAIPTAISIMDTAYLWYPQFFKKSDLYQLENWTNYSVKRAKKIFTISNSARNDIIKFYNKKIDDVIVTYPGIKMKNEKIISFGQLQKKYNITSPFVLFVGTLQPRKNITRLIEALSKINNNDLELVIIGKKGWMYEDILKAPDKYNVAQKVVFLDFVNDEDLPSFYSHARCFVLPSLYEGFGLPILEAMTYGCPVITSSISSLPEAGGDAALYIDPENTKDIADKITQVLSDEKLRSEMIEKGYKQIKKFSWEKTAKETLSVLAQLLKL